MRRDETSYSSPDTELKTSVSFLKILLMGCDPGAFLRVFWRKIKKIAILGGTFAFETTILLPLQRLLLIPLPLAPLHYATASASLSLLARNVAVAQAASPTASPLQTPHCDGIRPPQRHPPWSWSWNLSKMLKTEQKMK